jgi:hypothetical protein
VSGWDFPSLSLSPSFLPSFLPSFSSDSLTHFATVSSSTLLSFFFSHNAELALRPPPLHQVWETSRKFAPWKHSADKPAQPRRT